MFLYVLLLSLAFAASQTDAAAAPVLCGPTPHSTYKCLTTPKLLRPEVAAECKDKTQECEKMTCVFNKSGWMDGDKLDKTKFSAFFDFFAKEHPEWQDAARAAQGACLGDLPAQSVYLDCPAYDAMTCSFAAFLKNAPASQWKQTPECETARQFASSCPVCPSDCFAGAIPTGSCNACQGLPRSQ